MLVRVRVGQGASWSGCELTNGARVDPGASWYWGELTRKRPIGLRNNVSTYATEREKSIMVLF